jgi:hypothetical protein
MHHLRSWLPFTYYHIRAFVLKRASARSVCKCVRITSDIFGWSLAAASTEGLRNIRTIKRIQTSVRSLRQHFRL